MQHLTVSVDDLLNRENRDNDFPWAEEIVVAIWIAFNTTDVDTYDWREYGVTDKMMVDVADIMPNHTLTRTAHYDKGRVDYVINDFVDGQCWPLQVRVNL